MNHLSFYKITQKGIRLRMGKGAIGSLSKTTADHDEPPYRTIPNLQKAIATLFGLKPITIGALIAQEDGGGVE